MIDHWLICVEKHVSEKTGTVVSHQGQRTAYLLFYEKQVTAKLFMYSYFEDVHFWQDSCSAGKT